MQQDDLHQIRLPRHPMVHCPDTRYIMLHVLTSLSYVCSKSVTGYDHFNDRNRGGKEGNCPLFDNVEERHEQEILAAAEAAKKKLQEENPELADEDLEIRLSEAVKQQEEARKRRAQPGAIPLIPPGLLAPPPPPPLRRPIIQIAAHYRVPGAAQQQPAAAAVPVQQPPAYNNQQNQHYLGFPAFAAFPAFPFANLPEDLRRFFGQDQHFFLNMPPYNPAPQPAAPVAQPQVAPQPQVGVPGLPAHPPQHVPAAPRRQRHRQRPAHPPAGR
jgi:TRIAD3 protein (E3 ubiquitin-protein ligase RNF216)